MSHVSKAINNKKNKSKHMALALWRIVPWTIIDLLTEDRTFSAVFSEAKAGKYDTIAVCDELKRATIKQVMVGCTTKRLMVMSEKQSVLTICQEFGKFVEFRAELMEQ